MVVSALNQKISKRNIHSNKPAFKLIVNPNFKVKKQSEKSKIFSFRFKPHPFKGKKRKYKILTLCLVFAAIIVFCMLGTPILSQNRELHEFVFPDNQNTLFGSLYRRYLPADAGCSSQRQCLPGIQQFDRRPR